MVIRKERIPPLLERGFPGGNMREGWDITAKCDDETYYGDHI